MDDECPEVGQPEDRFQDTVETNQEYLHKPVTKGGCGELIAGVILGILLNVLLLFFGMVMVGDTLGNAATLIIPFLVALVVDWLIWSRTSRNDRPFARGFVVGTVAVFLLLGGCLAALPSF